jgi:hypothetical protein
VQWVEIDAAPIRLKYRVSQQVICINQHGGEHDQVSLFPVLPEKHPGNCTGKNQVEEIVYDYLHLMPTG